MVKVGSFAKALVAAVAAGAATLAAVTQDGGLDTGNVVTVVLSVLGALGVTYAVPNAGPSGPLDDSTN
jgi:uncharacterized protein YjdB